MSGGPGKRQALLARAAKEPGTLAALHSPPSSALFQAARVPGTFAALALQRLALAWPRLHL